MCTFFVEYSFYREIISINLPIGYKYKVFKTFYMYTLKVTPLAKINNTAKYVFGQVKKKLNNYVILMM